MVLSDDKDVAERGTKRKHADNDQVTKLTPSQRIAAARKAGTYTEFEGFNRPTEKETPTDTGPSNKRVAVDGTVGSTTATRTSPQASEKALGEEATSDVQRDERYFLELYQGGLDFKELGERDADFKALLKGERHLDFTDETSFMQLTKTLLKLDFGLQIKLRSDRLCPPVENRHNYILWLKELLDSTSSSYSEMYEPDRQVIGLDIGTGASAIYPLLGCMQRPQWSFIATDIDPGSLESARKNVKLNNLESRIQVIERQREDRLIPLDEPDMPSSIDFVMTNPPWYASKHEMAKKAGGKTLPAPSVCTGTEDEMICPGGDFGFFERILEESRKLRTRVKWYTVMMGIRDSLHLAVERLEKENIDNYAVAEFVQGRQTRRWAVAWSFAALRPSTRACRGLRYPDVTPGGKRYFPNPTEIVVAAKPTKGLQNSGAENIKNVFWTHLEDVTDGLDLVSWTLDETRLRGVGFVDDNVWGRAYRRRKERGEVPSSEEGEGRAKKKAVSACVFGFSFSIRVREEKGEEQVVAVLRWLQGDSFLLFESFGAFLQNVFLKVG